MNLFQETVAELENNGKTLDDVEFVIGNGHEITLDNFVEIAKTFEYDEYFGHEYVPHDLKIVGCDWWLERCEYDGSEWWAFRRKPDRPTATKRILAIDGDEYDQAKYVYGEKEK